MLKIKIWFIRSKRTQLKEKKCNAYRDFLQNSIERVFNLSRFKDKNHTSNL